jgi:hypothetical protein
LGHCDNLWPGSPQKWHVSNTLRPSNSDGTGSSNLGSIFKISSYLHDDGLSSTNFYVVGVKKFRNLAFFQGRVSIKYIVHICNIKMLVINQRLLRVNYKLKIDSFLISSH